MLEFLYLYFFYSLTLYILIHDYFFLIIFEYGYHPSLRTSCPGFFVEDQCPGFSFERETPGREQVMKSYSPSPQILLFGIEMPKNSFDS